MSSPFSHARDERAEMGHLEDARHGGSRPSVRITVTVANRYTFDSEVVTGRQIKETTGVPTGFALFRRTPDGNEAIEDDERIELRSGDHFFARPSSNAS